MYEQFRSSLAARLSERLPAGLLHDVLQEIDIVSADYEIKRACVDLIVSGGLPEIVKIYCASLAIEQKALGTIDGYRSELQRFFDTVRKPYTLVTTNDIRLYMHHREQTGLKKSTIEHIRVTINAFYSWLVDEEYLDRNPARKIPPIPVPKSPREPVSAVELEQIRAACVTPREKALIDFLFSTGCRISECAALDLRDIDFRDRSVRIRHGKGDKFRITYFNAESEVSLRVYLDSKPAETSALFSNSRAPYGHVSKEALEAEVRKIRARVPELSVTLTPHVLRHTFTTTAISNGAPVQHVQQLLGHASLDTTMIYTHLLQDDIRSSHRKSVT